MADNYGTRHAANFENGHVVAGFGPTLRQLDFVIAFDDFPFGRENQRGVVKLIAHSGRRADDRVGTAFLSCLSEFLFGFLEFGGGESGDDLFKIAT